MTGLVEPSVDTDWLRRATVEGDRLSQTWTVLAGISLLVIGSYLIDREREKVHGVYVTRSVGVCGPSGHHTNTTLPQERHSVFVL